jgi:hypothetical protein
VKLQNLLQNRIFRPRLSFIFVSPASIFLHISTSSQQPTAGSTCHILITPSHPSGHHPVGPLSPPLPPPLLRRVAASPPSSPSAAVGLAGRAPQAPRVGRRLLQPFRAPAAALLPGAPFLCTLSARGNRSEQGRGEPPARRAGGAGGGCCPGVRAGDDGGRAEIQGTARSRARRARASSRKPSAATAASLACSAPELSLVPSPASPPANRGRG